MLKRVLKKYPFFLLLLPVFILTHIERAYHGLIDYALVYGEIIWLFCIPPVAYLFSWLLMRSHRKAAVMCMALLVVYYSLGETKDALRAKWPESIWQSYIFLLTLFFAALVVIAILIKKNHSRFEKTYLFFNTVLICFLLFDIGGIIWSPADKKPIVNKSFNWPAQEKPDIYYFIFDSYTSTAFLQEKFGYDNSAIDTALVQKGFRIIPFSHSNYNLTPFSLGSTFSLDYLPGTDTTREYYLPDYLPGVRKILDNPLFPTLHRLGYEIYNHSLFDVRSYPTTVPAFDIWGLNSIYQQHNLLKKMDREIGWQFPHWMRISPDAFSEYAYHRDRHDSIALQHIYHSAGQRTSKPKFIYGHLFIPHGPYTFDSAGNKIDPTGSMPPEEDMKAYTHQIAWVNKVMTNLVDSILGSSKRPLVIIIQGDHGFRFHDRDKNQWEFPNFNAFYFSNGNYQWLHDSLTSVNTFRVVANTFFGQQYPLLPAKTHFLQYK